MASSNGSDNSVKLPQTIRVSAPRITIVVDPHRSWSIRGRGLVYQAGIESIDGNDHDHQTMEWCSEALRGVEIPDLGVIAGVEMFCGWQRVGSQIGVLIKDTNGL